VPNRLSMRVPEDELCLGEDARRCEG